MKVKNKKTLIAIAAVLLIAVVGVTFAYFQSSTQFRNIFVTGKYRLVSTEVFTSPDSWQPGEEIPKTVFTTNEGTVPAAVRISYTEKWFDGETEITGSVPSGTVIINFDNQNDWTKEGDYYYFNYILNPNETASSFIRSVTLSNNLNGVNCTGEGLTKTCESTSPIVGATYKLIFRIETIQIDKVDEWETNVEIVENPNGNNTSNPGDNPGGNSGDNPGGNTGEDPYIGFDGEVVPSCTPRYFAFGNPTTSSTTNYRTINYDVMGASCEDGTKGVCIKKNDTIECFMQNNPPYERQHLRSLYPNITCDGSNVNCFDDETTFTINWEYNCSIGANGRVGCGKVNHTNHSSIQCRTTGNVVECEEDIGQ